MSWIETIPKEEAQGELAELYRVLLDPSTGELDEIMAVHSLDPGGLAAHLGLYRNAMKSSPGVRKLDREMIALVVSRLNACHY